MRKIITMCFFILFIHTLSFPSLAQAFDASFFSRLDYGLYWFGRNEKFEKANESTALGSRFYQPSAPTFIYIHGWQRSSSRNLRRETFFNSASGGPNIDFAKMWRSKGYNIGILYWNQFADENEVTHAEAKIWSADGPRRMRWRNNNNAYLEGPSLNVTQLLVNDLIQALEFFDGTELRIAGHSLGNQLALTISEQLIQQSSQGLIPHTLIPQRITLLDSYYSRRPKAFLNRQTIGNVTLQIAQTLKEQGVAIESYRTSLTGNSLFSGDANERLHDSVAFAELSTRFFNQFQQTEKHIAATWLYFWSINFPTPFVDGTNRYGLSAASPQQIVIDWMSSENRLRQNQGGRSKTPEDNAFTTVRKRF